MTDLPALLVIVAAIAAATFVLRRREGAVRTVDGPGIDLAALGVPAGAAAFVEFTAPGCATCPRTEQVLRRVAEGRRDVVVVTVDVGDHLDLARAHGVLRAPTTLVVDPTGVVHHRIAGVPEADTVSAVLDGEHSTAA